MDSKSIKNAMVFLRYIPVCSFLLMFGHVILLNFGIDFPLSEIIVIVSGYYIAYSFSKVFDFCLLHRLLIYYAFAVMDCIWLRRFPNGENGWFGEYIEEARVVMLIIGCILFALLALKEISKIKDTRSR